jgi:hypothetical protein
MLAVPTAKTWNMLPLLMACLMVVAVAVCLVHPATPEQDHATHTGHHHPSSSHITLDLHCLTAILPAVVLLVWLCRGTLYLIDWWSYPVAPAFPPFIPPKAFIRS